MNSPLVSVLLPIYKEPLVWVHGAIESILKQDFPDFELILLLDAPERADRTELFADYLTDPRVQLQVNDSHLGLPGSLNHGLSVASGQYIARMDADDVAYPNRLSAQYAFLNDNPDIALCGTQTEKIGAAGERIGFSNLPEKFLVLKALLKFGVSLPHSTWFARREAYQQVGDYLNLPNSEDYEFMLRLVKRGGLAVACLPEVLIQYRLHDQSQSWNRVLDQRICCEHIRQAYFDGDCSGFLDLTKLEQVLHDASRCSHEPEKRAKAQLFRADQALKNGRYLGFLHHLLMAVYQSRHQRVHLIRQIRAIFLRHYLEWRTDQT